MKDKTVSAVVPVYREEKNISGVLRALLGSGVVDEIVCVVDEPTRHCLNLIKPFGKKIRLIVFKKGGGKGRALAAGVRAAKSEIILFLDSDLIGLTSRHILSLIEPVKNGRSRVVVAAPQVELKSVFGKWVPLISGDRVYHKKDLWPHLKEMADKGYGVELFLSHVLRGKGQRIIPLVGVINPYKEEKWPWHLALKRYLVAGIDLAEELARRQVVAPRQLRNLKKLAQAVNLTELGQRLEGLGNQDVKKVFEKYFLRYRHYLKKITSRVKI